MTISFFADAPMAPGIASDLRAAWLVGHTLRVTLSERCDLPFIVGRVSSVSPTGALAVINGWSVPIDDITSVARPTHDEVAEYARRMHAMREAAAS